MAAISEMLNEALRDYDQNLVLMAGATASVVVVSGLAYCCSSGEEEKPSSPGTTSRSTTNNNIDDRSEKKKEGKTKPKKKSSGAKKLQVEAPVVEKKKQQDQLPQQSELTNEEEMEFVKPKKSNKKSRKAQKQEVEKPIERAPSPSPPRAPSPPPPPPPQPVKQAPSPPPAAPKKEEMKTKSTKTKKGKSRESKESTPAPAPVVVEEPEPEPEPEVVPMKKEEGSKKSKKNKKNKEAAQTTITTTTTISMVETLVEPQSNGDSWTTVKTKRSSKSSLSQSKNGSSSEVMMDVSVLEQEMMVDVSTLEQEMNNQQEIDEGCSIDLGIFVSAVIGREGKTIKSITEQSGAKLKVGGKNGDSSICVITGDDDAVALAQELIQEILDREQAIKDNNIEVNVHVGDKMPAVIGKKGLIIKKIVSESGAVIDRLPDEDVLVIRGFAEQVAAAKALIDLYMAGGPPPEAREEVELGSERGRFIVLGPKGQTIRNIQEETGAKLNLEHNKTFVSVEGDEDAVAAAVAQLRALLDENSACEKVSTRGREGNSHIPAIIGKQGATIRALRDATGAAIDLLSAEDCVKISGTKEQVKKARAAIQKILDVEDTPPYEKLKKGEVCEKLPIPLSAIGMVIGRMGSMIKQIKEESGAEILVPKGASDEVPGIDGGDPTTTAKVWGTPGAVEKAIVAIKEVLKKHEERAKNDKKRAAATKTEGNASNGKSASSKSSGGGDGSITFFTTVDDDIMPETEINFEVGDIKVQNDWDAAAADNSAPPGITAAPGWS